MTASRRAKIGFSRKLEQEWLDASASYAISSSDPSSAHALLKQMLGSVLPSSPKRGALEKTVTVLSRIWFDPDARVLGLRDRALSIIDIVDQTNRIAIHWAMVMASYPFFVDVVINIGRLIALNGMVSLAQIMLRMKELWGDRTTVPPAIRSVMRSLVSWGVLIKGEQYDSYTKPARVLHLKPSVSILLVEAILLDQESNSLPFSNLVSHPSIFPFQMDVQPHDLARTGMFLISRQGLDLELVELREPKIIV